MKTVDWNNMPKCLRKLRDAGPDAVPTNDVEESDEEAGEPENEPIVPRVSPTVEEISKNHKVICGDVCICDQKLHMCPIFMRLKDGDTPEEVAAEYDCSIDELDDVVHGKMYADFVKGCFVPAFGNLHCGTPEAENQDLKVPVEYSDYMGHITIDSLCWENIVGEKRGRDEDDIDMPCDFSISPKKRKQLIENERRELAAK